MYSVNRETLTRKEKIKAVIDNDAKFDGLFFLGVKSTGIFCLPSCRAKTPLVKNMIFFDTKEEAINHDFRGCKRCRSEFFPNTEPSWFKQIIKKMREDPNLKFNLSDMANLASVHESTIIRYFKEYHNTTPIAFYREIIMQKAKARIVEGNNYINVAYELGFESISGFRDAYIRIHGKTPGIDANER